MENPRNLVTDDETQLIFIWQKCQAQTGMGGSYQHCWPDGRALLDQPAILVSAFSIIEAMVREVTKAKRPKP